MATTSTDPLDPSSAAYLLNVTDAIESSGSNQLLQTVGFRIHRVKLGAKFALVKVYEGLPPGSVLDPLKDNIHDELLEDLKTWKRMCSVEHFAKLVGFCDSEDSLLPAPVLEAKTYAADYLSKAQELNFIDFCLPLAKGFAYLHSIPMAHGDIRAENILVGANGQPLIGDYGLSRIMRMLDRYRVEPALDISPTRWMPIEWIHLDSNDVREPTMHGDVWSFGMTMLELWSLHPPYFGVKPEKVSVMINDHHLPSFPPRSNVWRNDLEEEVKFVCNLCWYKSPQSRRSMTELVQIMNDLKKGTDLQSIQEYYQVETFFPDRSTVTSPLPSLFGSGLSELESSSFSLQNSIRFDPAGSYTANFPFRRAFSSSPISNGSDRTVKASGMSDSVRSDNSATVSEWSDLHNSRLRDDYGRGTAAGESSQRARSLGRGNAKPLNSIPPPPSPDKAWGSVASMKTAFLNYIYGNRKQTKVEFKTHNKGEPHSPEWTAICLLNGRQYAKITHRGKKKDAEEEVARVAMEKMCIEDPSAMTTGSPSYLSTFKTYLAEHDLSHRIEWLYDSEGDPHTKTWICEIRRDGIALARGTALKKADAAEEAAREAFRAWNRSLS